MAVACQMARVWGLLTVLGLSTAAADTYILPPTDVDLIGQINEVKADAVDTLLDIARRHGVGHDEMILANPNVDRWIPGEGTPVVVPARYILPDAARRGIVLNVPEMRLYYYPVPETGAPSVVITHPVSIGRMDWGTPLGATRVVAKVKNPAWRPPKSIREEAAARGDTLPDVVPPGPDNPLGAYALRLGIPGYLIHSTNRPYGVGMRVTHGCVRMYPEDIERLFERIPVSTPVNIVNQPVKAGWLADTLYLEVHPALEEDRVQQRDPFEVALELIQRATAERPVRVDDALVRDVVREQRGVPIAVSMQVWENEVHTIEAASDAPGTGS